MRSRGRSRHVHAATDRVGRLRLCAGSGPCAFGLGWYSKKIGALSLDRHGTPIPNK